jgi:hypothetical protein
MISSILLLISATTGTPAIPAVIAVPSPSSRQEASLAGDKYPKKCVEKIQEVQYDGEYSPPVGRPAEPTPSATVPVRYIPPYMRAIPVIVKPAPIYVTEDEVQQQAQQKQQAQAQAQQQSYQQSYQANPASAGTSLTAGPIETPGVLPSAGSPTGSTAIATYGALPQATVVDEGNSRISNN